MNRKLREETPIDIFFKMIKDQYDIPIKDYLSEIRSYWIKGIIKYVCEDGTWIESKEGDESSFLLRRYNEKQNYFTIYYPCKEPCEVKKSLLYIKKQKKW